MKKTNLVLLIVVIVLIVLIAGGIVLKLIVGSQYSAVQLIDGQTYFGKLTRFPSYGLKQVYTIQVTQNEKNPLSIQRFKDLFWGPKDFIKINKDNVIWCVHLDSEGQMAQLLENNPNLQAQQPTAGQNTSPQGSQQQVPPQIPTE